MSKKGDIKHEKYITDSLVSILGLPENKLMVGIKGDTSLRETACTRTKTQTFLDDNFDQLKKVSTHVLSDTGVFNLALDFSNSEIRTTSVFDPFATEVHTAQQFLDDDFVEKNYPPISYLEKMEFIRQFFKSDVYKPMKKRLPTYWREVVNHRAEVCKPMSLISMKGIISSLKSLREIENYYLKFIALNVAQNVIHLRFNCDGTVIVAESEFCNLVKDYF